MQATSLLFSHLRYDGSEQLTDLPEVTQQRLAGFGTRTWACLVQPQQLYNLQEETHSLEKHTDHPISPLGRPGVGSVVMYVAFYHPPRTSVEEGAILV